MALCNLLYDRLLALTDIEADCLSELNSRADTFMCEQAVVRFSGRLLAFTESLPEKL